MGSRGSVSRPSGPVGRWRAGLVAAVLVLTACSGGRPPAPLPSTGSSTSAPAAGPSSPAPVGEGPPCPVALPDRWQQALVPVAAGSGAAEQVVLVTPDGTSYAVEGGADGATGLRWRRGTDSGVVQDFRGHPSWQVLAPTFDGRYLAYRVDHSLDSFADFSLYVWDSTTKAPPVEVAHGERDRKGRLMATPLVDPVVHDGWVYWSQTRDQDPARTVLSAYRVADGHREVLRRGYGQVPVRWGSLLLWPDAPEPGTATRLQAFDLQTRRPVPAPAALADVRGPSYLAGDARTLAWVTSDGSRLLVHREGWSTPRVLVDGADAAEFLDVAGDVVVFQQSDAVYAADLRSWSSAKVTPEYGSISADGGPFVVVGYRPESPEAASKQVTLDLRTVPPLGRDGC